MKRTLILGLILVAAPALAQDKKAESKKGAPDDAAMMAAMQKYATPGPEHALLKQLAGQWTCSVKMWMKPGAPPTESPSTSEIKTIMGDRYVLEQVKGNFMGMPFEGSAVMGFDNGKKKYVGAWIDNMGTGIMSSEGSYDAAKKTFTMESTFTDPMTNKTAHSRDVLRIESPNKMVREMWAKQGGKDTKMMEITYTRKSVAAK